MIPAILKQRKAVMLAWLALATLPLLAVEFPLYVYKNGNAKENKYIPSGFTGDYSAIQMDIACTSLPKDGKSCLKFIYTAKPTQGLAWAGVFFQNPANNWGTVNAGLNITGAKKMKFSARGEKGGEILQFKMGGISSTYSDSDTAATSRITLGKDWKDYEIDLTGIDLSYILSGFAWTARAEDNPEGCIFYIDEIMYVN